MKIGIDARLINETGIGIYTRNLIQEMGVADDKNTYVVYLPKNAYDSFDLPNPRWEKRLAQIPWHSVREQLLMPWIFIKEHFDLVHIPYHNIPIFYPGKFVVTIHDLTILHFNTGKATTLPLFLYKLRRLGYFITLAVGLRRAAHIIAVSETTKQEIIDHFQIHPGKITVTYEAVRKIGGTRKRLVTEPYLLYVGNAYPHKNLEYLIRCFRCLVSADNKTKLVLVGNDDFFYGRLKRIVGDLKISDRVLFFGSADTGTLRSLYAYALALVFPSLMEGFGLPPLEALSEGCPVICSDIPVFREILDSVPMYIDPFSEKDLVATLKQTVADPLGLREKQLPQANKLLAKYRWDTMAHLTLSIYKETVSHA